jgi:hypothetical protein
MVLASNEKHRRIEAALRAAGPRGLTKNELAQAVWGSVTASTQSMTTRLTQKLIEDGTLTEEPDGRRRIVRLTKLEPAKRRRFDVERAVEQLHAGDLAGDARPFDRPYAQLERAVRFAGATLQPDREDDRRFAWVLLHLLDFSGDAYLDATEDHRAIEEFVRDWPECTRRKLCRAIGVFGLSRERDFMAQQLLEIAGEVERGEALLWVAMSMAVARRLWLIGGDRALHDHDRLVKAARKHLKRLDGFAPVHAAYWKAFARIVRGDLVEDAWRVGGPGAVRTAAALPIDGSALAKKIRDDEDEMRGDNADFNSFFSRLEAVISKPLVHEVSRRVGFADRYRHDQGASAVTAVAWARDRARMISKDVLPWLRRSQSGNAALRRLTKDARRLRTVALPGTRASRDPSFDLAIYLGGTEAEAEDTRARASSRPPIEYTDLIRNNFWTPSMLWADVALSTHV